MLWPLGGAILLVVGLVLRRVLGFGVPSSSVRVRLDGDREHVYRTTALELETQSTMLAVSLNDAIEEGTSGHWEIARALFALAASEWDHLAEILRLLLRVLNENLPLVQTPVPMRTMGAEHFKSQIMIDHVRLHELLEQVVFRSKLRFHLQVRVLRHAVEVLTVDFRRARPGAYPLPKSSGEMWSRLDRDFHDLDLISKETLLTFRAFLAGLPTSRLPGLAAELQPVVERGARSGLLTGSRQVLDPDELSSDCPSESATGQRPVHP